MKGFKQPQSDFGRLKKLIKIRTYIQRFLVDSGRNLSNIVSFLIRPFFNTVHSQKVECQTQIEDNAVVFYGHRKDREKAMANR